MSSNPITAADNAEVEFRFEELFFSRTDHKGIILSGNSVFQRVSLYEWEEILKKPHNLIRHPDMPKAVFYLLWDFLKKGKPIGAYVKNRAKDGRYYWVFAIATPIEGGYLSVRLKPGSDLFKIIQSEYKSLLAFEKETKISPKESAVYLLQRLKALGFDSYEEFMSAAVSKEMANRDVKLDLPNDQVIESFRTLTAQSKSIMQETDKVFSSYEVNKYVPLNLQVQSFRLGDEGKTIGVISGNYNIVSAEIREEIDKFRQSASEVFHYIYEGQFLSCTARIQREVFNYFSQEAESSLINKNHEMHLLELQQKQYHKKVIEGLNAIINKIVAFQEDCTRMKRCSASLEVIRVMGKVDAARLSGSHGGLNELINDLKTFQMAIADSLMTIEQFNAEMKYDTQKILAALKAA